MKNRNTHNSYILNKVLFALFLCFSTLTVSAQTINITVPWIASMEIEEAGVTRLTPAIRGLEYQDAMPIYSIVQKSKKGKYAFSVGQIELENAKQEDIDLVDRFGLEVPTSVKINSSVSKSNVDYYLQLQVIPYVLENGILKRILKCTVNCNLVGQLESVNNQKSYVSSSVLSTGDWYKISVSADGVFKLDKSFLESIGVNLSTFNPQSLNIYGNADGKLGEQNSDPYMDDLKKNAIYAVGETDGVFDDADYYLFYGAGPNKWSYSQSNGFDREQHIYSVENHYFIHIDNSDAPLRITNASNSSSSPTSTVTTYDFHDIHELEKVSLVKGGQRWYGELFDAELSQNVAFSVPAVVSSPMHVSYAVASKSGDVANNFKVFYNTTAVDTLGLGVAANDYVRANGDFYITPSGNTVNLNFVLNRVNPAVSSYLDFVKIEGKRNLTYGSQAFGFRNISSIGIGNVTKYSVQSTNPSLTVWEITANTTPKSVILSPNGSNYEFTHNSDTLREYFAFTLGNVGVPTFVGKVENQDVHALDQTEYLIVTHANFIQQAERLASLHRANGLTVHVVTTDQIYNEFSSGNTDATAIRRFTKMFYDRANGNVADQPKHLLLFGDGTYDPKNRVGGNNYFIPTYQVINSEDVIEALVTDDYFGMLDNNESINGSDLMDINVGRLLISNNTQAVEQVNKIEHYMKNGSSIFGNTGPNSCCSQSDNTTWGDWRQDYTIITDDNDNGENGYFIKIDAEPLISQVQSNYPEMNYDKIYTDAYQQTITAGGQRYPEVFNAITEKIERGSLIMNYIGHGGEVGAASVRIITIHKILAWNNVNRLGLFVSATCEFTKFDDPSRVSAGEWVSLNPTGGSIALMTTTRSVYFGVNDYILFSLYTHVFERDANNDALTYGEIMTRTKNTSGTSTNRRSFNLIGDPALRIALPKWRIVTDSINHMDPTVQMDTVRALSKMYVAGHVEDYSGNVMTDFNGVLSPTIYDKPKDNFTLGNDAGSPILPFKTQKNSLFKGKATIKDGFFSFEFIVPKDINYNYGKGKVSLYGNTTLTDADGMDTNFVVGGINLNAPVDLVGPEVEVYLNDDQFVNGGISSQTPLLVVSAKDEFGINTVGNGIGHDMTAVVDGNTSNPIVLNEYYIADLDSYKSGKAQYTLPTLSVGRHNLEVKVWDVNNNSTISTIDFEVVADESVQLSHVLNYPNPFTTHTTFFYEHNQSCSNLNTQIQIYTVSGRLVKTINENVSTSGFRVTGIEWDGTDEFGDQLAKGVYVYRLSVELPDGTKAQKIEKLVLLR